MAHLLFLLIKDKKQLGKKTTKMRCDYDALKNKHSGKYDKLKKKLELAKLELIADQRRLVHI